MRWLEIIAGIVLIILGIAGLILPGLQGIALIVAGVLMLAQRIPVVAASVASFEAKHPSVLKITSRLRSKNGTLDLRPLVLAIVIASVVWAAIAFGTYHLFFR